MNNKHRKTLQAIFADPVNGNVEWRKIEALFLALGCTLIEGSGSRITIVKDNSRADFHRLHPGKEALRYCVKDAREFLRRIGVTP